jgi:hypothetical protein
LRQDYIQWFCEQVRLPAALNPDVVYALFARASFRPEMLGAAADALRFDFDLQPEEVPERFSRAVEEQIEASNAEQLRVVHSLTPLQSAVLCVLASQGPAYVRISTIVDARFSVIVDGISG